MLDTLKIALVDSIINVCMKKEIIYALIKAAQDCLRVKHFGNELEVYWAKLLSI